MHSNRTRGLFNIRIRVAQRDDLGLRHHLPVPKVHPPHEPEPDDSDLQHCGTSRALRVPKEASPRHFGARGSPVLSLDDF